MYTVYSKPSCPYCVKAKELLQRKMLPFEEVHIDVGQAHAPDTRYITKEELVKLIPNARTVPQVVLTTENSAVVIGGYDDLSRFLSRAG